MSLYCANQTRSELDNKSSQPTLVFPVCTNPVLRLGLESILFDAGFVVWHDIVDGFSSLPTIEDELPALFIIDKGSFASGSIDLVRRLKAHAPAARIVLLADAFDSSFVSTAWDAGAHGFCLSTHARDVLVKSLELVMLGEGILPATIVLPIAGARTCHAHPHEGRLEGNVAALPNRRLSNREAEILTCLRDGAPNKVIARKLNLSEATVKVHVKTILKKIGACNRTQAAIWAARYAAADATALQSS
ncbi:response regulator transcription factor [Microvirga sp. CF3016]|uniref:response regulator transcription factor n=1 Tax=Microvirga sp. CF3016 TaxID=3110181 RepID=UPI002E7734E1|nr:response regulator transcription factor [Microvirga sp. CF3016]MEE1612496.1 response regulator transcription factor [Microvirga sp. CF3016]